MTVEMSMAAMVIATMTITAAKVRGAATASPSLFAGRR
jgi:hypothetical protein